MHTLQYSTILMYSYHEIHFELDLRLAILSQVSCCPQWPSICYEAHCYSQVPAEAREIAYIIL